MFLPHFEVFCDLLLIRRRANYGELCRKGEQSLYRYYHNVDLRAN